MALIVFLLPVRNVPGPATLTRCTGISCICCSEGDVLCSPVLNRYKSVAVHYGYCTSNLLYRTGGVRDGGLRNTGYVSAEFGRDALGSGR